MFERLSSVAAIVKVPAESSYVNEMFEPAVSNESTLSSTLSFVKNRFPFSAKSPVSKFNVPPNDSELEFIVTLELDSLLLSLIYIGYWVMCYASDGYMY